MVSSGSEGVGFRTDIRQIQCEQCRSDNTDEDLPDHRGDHWDLCTGESESATDDSSDHQDHSGCPDDADGRERVLHGPPPLGTYPFLLDPLAGCAPPAATYETVGSGTAFVTDTTPMLNGEVVSHPLAKLAGASGCGGFEG